MRYQLILAKPTAVSDAVCTGSTAMAGDQPTGVFNAIRKSQQMDSNIVPLGEHSSLDSKEGIRAYRAGRDLFHACRNQGGLWLGAAKCCATNGKLLCRFAFFIGGQRDLAYARIRVDVM
ncbi:hypothetical protein C8035_v001143 [Colletotrichum spinosum]|uniref:Uncharacterized protein n=1 Tax=Colletotrichum spinosum TaxID=1347390 RepID=A0A4R8QGF7_9PEZI|nr:hypothetical protein C8035_v001143 [Colletotrichum spinosum]